MSCIHKTFYGFRTVFLYVFAILFCAHPALAANPLFTVENVKVDVTAESAVAARAQAFEKAQVDAFALLAERILSASDLANFKAPDVDTVSTMIQDYEIANEQLSSVRYVASYTIRFREEAIKRYFANANISYADISSGSALVLPFLRRDGQTLLWSPYNVWKDAWDRAGNVTSGAVPLVVPLGDIADVQDIGDGDALGYNNNTLERLLERYATSEAIIMIAEPDGTLASVQNASDAAVGTLNVHLYRTDRGSPEFVQSAQVVAGDSDTLGSLMDKAVAEIRGTLKANWKSQVGAAPADSSSLSSPSANTLEARVSYSSLKEWAETQRALRRVYGIRDLKIRSVTPNEARIAFGFDGDMSRLELALVQSGLSLEAPQEESIRYDSMSHYASGGASAGGVYRLYLNRNRGYQ